jgi:hypothetical protein
MGARTTLRELEAYYGRDANPVHALKAFAIACHAGIALPDWLLAYLVESADRFLKVCDEAADGATVEREAELVGKAFGFGAGGPGRGKGWVRQAALLRRDRAIYFDVAREVDAGTKPYIAYFSVAQDRRISPSTVSRAYLRIKNEK